MQIILDEGLETERIYEADNVEERAIDQRITASKSWPINQPIPHIDLGDKRFTTIKITNGTHEMPVFGTGYNAITNFQTSEYSGGDALYMTLSFGVSV